MASRSETFLADEILATNEAVVQRNAEKATNFGLSVLPVGRKLFSCWICSKSRKKSLDEIAEMFVNCKQSSY